MWFGDNFLKVRNIYQFLSGYIDFNGYIMIWFCQLLYEYNWVQFICIKKKGGYFNLMDGYVYKLILVYILLFLLM